MAYRKNQELDGGHLELFRITAFVTAVIGALGSVALMLYAGRRQQSKLLILLFGGWVLCPFLAALFTSATSKSWPAATRAALYSVILLLTIFSLGIYGGVALGYLKAKIGFTFLVVPLGCLLVAGVVVGAAALSSRRQ